MIPICIVLFGLNLIAVGCMSDIRKLTPDATIIDFCFATKLRRIVMLLAPFGLIIGIVSLTVFIVKSVIKLTAKYIQGK